MAVVRETSIKTYKEILKSGLVGKRQTQVLVALNEIAPATDRMIARHLEFDDPNKVRPRRKDLVDMGIVEEVYDGKCEVSGRTSGFWDIKKKIEFKKRPKRKTCPYCQGKGCLPDDGQVKLGWNK